MSPLDPEVPPAGEEIHLPSPSIVPLLTALGVTLILIGITTFVELSIVGAVLTICCVIRWIKDTRADVDQLPL